MIDLLLSKKPDVECGGVFLRCVVNNFASGDRISFRTEYRLLKKRSCQGCCDDKDDLRCGVEGFLDELGEWGTDLLEPPSDPENGAVYKVEYSGASERFYLTKVK